MDAYSETLGSILCETERIYGIARNEKELSEEIISIIKRIDSEVLSLSSEEILKRNTEVGKQMVLLSYLLFRLSYFESVRLEFGQFPALADIAEVLDLYREKKNFNKCARKVNMIIKLLSEMDKTSAKIRLGMPYRYLRLFVVLVMYHNSCNASIVAELLLRQMLLQ